MAGYTPQTVSAPSPQSTQSLGYITCKNNIHNRLPPDQVMGQGKGAVYSRSPQRDKQPFTPMAKIQMYLQCMFWTVRRSQRTWSKPTDTERTIWPPPKKKSWIEAWTFMQVVQITAQTCFYTGIYVIFIQLFNKDMRTYTHTRPLLLSNQLTDTPPPPTHPSPVLRRILINSLLNSFSENRSREPVERKNKYSLRSVTPDLC